MNPFSGSCGWSQWFDRRSSKVTAFPQSTSGMNIFRSLYGKLPQICVCWQDGFVLGLVQRGQGVGCCLMPSEQEVVQHKFAYGTAGKLSSTSCRLDTGLCHLGSMVRRPAVRDLQGGLTSAPSSCCITCPTPNTFVGRNYKSPCKVFTTLLEAKCPIKFFRH